MLLAGIDLVEIDRIKKSIENRHFFNRVFGPSERAQWPDPPRAESVAAAFAVKEAFGKALGTGVSGFALSEVETLHEPSGKPYLKLSGRALEMAGGLEFSLSISHTKNYAIAIVIGIRK